MNRILVLIIMYISCGVSEPLLGQRFDCDGQSLIAMYDGNKTAIARPVYIPFSTPFVSPIAVYFDTQLDALGFNPRDHYIYGLDKNTNSIVRLLRNNTLEVLGSVAEVDTVRSYAGDCSRDGIYVIHDYALQQILMFDVLGDFSLIAAVDLLWDPEALIDESFNLQLHDIVFDPNQADIAYAYQQVFTDNDEEPNSTRGMILRINLNLNDPNVGVVTPMVELDKDIVTHMGALLFTPNAQLIGFGSNAEEVHPKQTFFYGINIYTGDVSKLVISNQGAQTSDGCSCPYSFTFSCDVPTEGMFCNGDTKNVVLRIENNSFESYENVTLIDTLPIGMQVGEVSGNFSGTVSIRQWEEQEILEISELKIPAKSLVEINVGMLSIDAEVGSNYNQAFLYDLPDKFGEFIPSDQVITTTVPDDPSLFIVMPRRLDDVTWEVSPPTDCLPANNGRAYVTSSQFFPDQEYEITLRNKEGWEEAVYNVRIGSDHSFLIDSLVPGVYQLRQIRSLLDNCSLAVQDTAIIVEAPDAQIDLRVASNSPICEGSDLIFEAIMQPEGKIRWTGPNLFGYDDLNPQILEASTDYDGSYKIVANYGYCEKIEFLDVRVKPEVTVNIAEKLSYCERDQVAIEAEMSGTPDLFYWKNSIGILSKDSILTIASIDTSRAGKYALMISNGACMDTAYFEISVRISPTIDMSDRLITDYCDPLRFDAIVTGGSNIRYAWSPVEGLTCSDCPNPVIEPILADQYMLRVQNENNCVDSATVRLLLDQRKIIYTPNIFDINASQENDRFSIYPSCIIHSVLVLNIYDRWGSLVYSDSSDNPREEPLYWDGYFNGQRASQGTYLWTAEVELVNGDTKILKGSVVLL